MTKCTALVSGFARSFISGEPISGGIITVLENPDLIFETDINGRFGPFEWPIGEPITLVFEKQGSFWSGYKTTQTATIIVPEEGINDDNYLKNISFQVPSNMAYAFFSLAMGGTEDPSTCQITTTITPPNTTMDDIPQGVAGVKAILSPNVNPRTHYFGILPIIDKTDPFIRDLEYTSADGGVAFINVPPGQYTIEVLDENENLYSSVSVTARANCFVNVSPPHGPTMLNKAGFFKAATATPEILEENLDMLNSNTATTTTIK